MRIRFVCLFFLVPALLFPNLAVAETSWTSIDADIVSKQIPLIEKAILSLEEHLQKNPTDGEALWLTAKAYLYLGDKIKDGKLKAFETGKEYADRAVEHLPESAHSHYWQSALIGRIGQTRGILSSLFMVRPMKNALDRVLELDQDYADAYWILSQLYHQAPGFPLSIGDKKLALENVTKALELDPENPEYILQLGKALDYNGRKAEAKEVIHDLLQMASLDDDPDLKAEVEEFSAKINK